MSEFDFPYLPKKFLAFESSSPIYLYPLEKIQLECEMKEVKGDGTSEKGLNFEMSREDTKTFARLCVAFIALIF